MLQNIPKKSLCFFFGRLPKGKVRPSYTVDTDWETKQNPTEIHVQ